MGAAEQRDPRAESVAVQAIGRRWPGASSETVSRLARAGSLVENATGTLMAQGEHPSRVSLVLGGTFIGTWNAPDGRTMHGRIVEVDASGPGQFVGITTLTGGPLISGLDALTEVTLLSWPSSGFRAISDADLAVSLDLLDESITAIQWLDHLIQLGTFTTATTRLAGYLLRYESFCFSTDTPLVARRLLAPLASVTAQMVSRILRHWEAAGILRRVGASGLELIDRSALEAVAAPLVGFPAPGPRAVRTPAVRTR